MFLAAMEISPIPAEHNFRIYRAMGDSPAGFAEVIRVGIAIVAAVAFVAGVVVGVAIGMWWCSKSTGIIQKPGPATPMPSPEPSAPPPREIVRPATARSRGLSKHVKFFAVSEKANVHMMRSCHYIVNRSSARVGES